ncbi:hypothetical protein HYW41_02195 [Candidatus Daviesbacteria bacterium]|nr:hypothetical protein [Candidatus Daviesbacteria bacterium]
MKKNKLLLLIFKLTLFIILVSSLIVRNYQSTIFDQLFYWWILLLMIFIGLTLHFKSIFYLSSAFILFFISAILTVVGSKEIAEGVMRISLIGWLIGLIQSVVEYKIS